MSTHEQILKNTDQAITAVDSFFPNGIHHTALVSAKAEIGESVSIGPYAVVEDDVIIGDDVWIGPHACIGKGTTIGGGCRIYHGVVTGTEPQDLKYRGIPTTVEIGEETVLREYCTIHRGTDHRLKTVLGRRNYLMAYTHIGHDCIIGDDVIIANAVNLGGHVVIDDCANLGAMVGFHQYVRVGKHTFIAGGFRLVKDAPPYIMASGEPMKFHGLNSVGLRRSNFSKRQLKDIKDAYRIIYRSSLNVSQALKRIHDEMTITPEIQEILDFIEKSERGII